MLPSQFLVKHSNVAMLKIYIDAHAVDFAQLRQVYAESAGEYFYEDTLDFFKESGNLFAIWIVNGKYKCALRWQRFRDGYLISGIETRPGERRKGYAKCLLKAVLDHFRDRGNIKVYSHIHKDNLASLALHRTCTFKKISDRSVLLDGSASGQYATFLIEI